MNIKNLIFFSEMLLWLKYKDIFLEKNYINISIFMTV